MLKFILSGDPAFPELKIVRDAEGQLDTAGQLRNDALSTFLRDPSMCSCETQLFAAENILKRGICVWLPPAGGGHAHIREVNRKPAAGFGSIDDKASFDRCIHLVFKPANRFMGGHFTYLHMAGPQFFALKDRPDREASHTAQRDAQLKKATQESAASAKTPAKPAKTATKKQQKATAGKKTQAKALPVKKAGGKGAKTKNGAFWVDQVRTGFSDSAASGADAAPGGHKPVDVFGVSAPRTAPIRKVSDKYAWVRFYPQNMTVIDNKMTLPCGAGRPGTWEKPTHRLWMDCMPERGAPRVGKGVTIHQLSLDVTSGGCAPGKGGRRHEDWRAAVKYLLHEGNDFRIIAPVRTDGAPKKGFQRLTLQRGATPTVIVPHGGDFY